VNHAVFYTVNLKYPLNQKPLSCVHSVLCMMQAHSSQRTLILLQSLKECRADNKVTSDYILVSLLSGLIRTSYLAVLLPTVFHPFPATDEALIVLWTRPSSSLH